MSRHIQQAGYDPGESRRVTRWWRYHWLSKHRILMAAQLRLPCTTPELWEKKKILARVIATVAINLANYTS